MAAVLVVAVVGVAFGTGYSATRALSSDGSAWLRKGDTIVHINGPSLRYDATVANRPVALAAAPSDPLEVVQDPSGQVFVADPVSHKVYEIDLSSMAPQPVGQAGSAVLASSGAHYVVAPAKSAVIPFNPQNLALAAPIHIPGGIAGSAIASDGVAYIGSNAGTVTVISGGRAHTAPVGAQSQPIDVTLVGTQPVAIGTTDGQLHLLKPNSPASKNVISLPGPQGATVVLASALQPGSLWLIRGTQLIQVNLATGETQQVTLPLGHTFGPPVANAGDAYVPDDTANVVLRYTPAMTLAQRIAVPPGVRGQTGIEVVVKDGKVWADDPTSSEATIVSPNGTTETANKGTGDGVVSPGGPPRPVTKRRPAAGPGQHSRGAPSARPAPTPVPTPTVSTRPSTPPEPTVSTDSSAVPPRPTSPPVSPTTTPQAPPRPATPAGAVPDGLEGQTVTVACAAVTKAGFECAPNNLGEAAAGQAPDQVTAVPQQGQTLPAHSHVEVDYYGTGASFTVPPFTPPSQGGIDPQSYCGSIPSGYHCVPRDEKKGNPAGVVINTDPAPGNRIPYGGTVTVNYYGSSAPVPVPVPGQNGVPGDPRGYCTYAQGHGFATCHTDDLGFGTPVNQVVSTSPPFNPQNSVPYGSDLTANYYGTAATSVPDLGGQSGGPTGQACATLARQHLNCDSTGGTDEGAAPIGTPTGVISGSENPAAATVVAANTAVTFRYYSSQQTSTVPNCSGSIFNNCPAAAGVTWAAPIPDPSPELTAVQCGTVVDGQSVPPGTTISQPTTVTPYYDKCAQSIGISEWHLTNNGYGKVHYLELGSAPRPNQARGRAQRRQPVVTPRSTACAPTERLACTGRGCHSTTAAASTTTPSRQDRAGARVRGRRSPWRRAYSHRAGLTGHPRTSPATPPPSACTPTPSTTLTGRGPPDPGPTRCSGTKPSRSPESARAQSQRDSKAQRSQGLDGLLSRASRETGASDAGTEFTQNYPSPAQ